ncbi:MULTISPECIES: pyridoxamine 5'-phosphate oxidase family protein [unclassified Kaistella]|uniref:pyridoxamine 5'-phosphate oxidase family protein n=1 Tax=unclassified Kaistella TaxID=2762626 RepID=UPI0027355A43|nr:MULTISPECIES: pyridoxamine 5'-phosphate oxidase family protein [unclassified Kaistella]MDP2455059.1 pyridoxamine 5'-phosphate oxidase family protein [Kaistella sp. SH11-4b]MDP2457967.1 pyridoxamine 5'-phosphate oxidase family protein [Kaistella sp. SH40-3]MDP2460889.1 pyridoxamine 5'-phosphate oxidase family protein [Kaistella sp. SH19-2b]
MGQAQSPQKDLGGQEAIEKIKKLTEKAGICFFTTKVGPDAHSVPMSLQEVDENGTLWFISPIDSTHNQNILEDSAVQLHFQNDSSYEFVFIKGQAKISQDQTLIEKYYSHFADAWFDGKDDPRVTVIGVTPVDGYYYETKDNKVFAMAKMIFAAVTGSKNEDGGIEGGLKV